MAHGSLGEKNLHPRRHADVWGLIYRTKVGVNCHVPFLKEPLGSRPSRRILLRTFYVQSCFSLFFWIRAGLRNRLWYGLFTVFVLRGCSRRSFRRRRHPYPFLREYVCLTAVVQVRRGPDTEYSVADEAGHGAALLGDRTQAVGDLAGIPATGRQSPVVRQAAWVGETLDRIDPRCQGEAGIRPAAGDGSQEPGRLVPRM